MLDPEMRWLGLDVGASRVGVAVGDEAEGVVTALDPLPFASPEELAHRVAALAAERGCGGVALGVPRTRRGTSRGERRVAAVARALGQFPELSLVLVDETGTTAEAEARLRAAGVPRRRWPALVDGVAATILLEDVFASRRRGGLTSLT
jgi:putative Holliday junction resolvase